MFPTLFSFLVFLSLINLLILSLRSFLCLSFHSLHPSLTFPLESPQIFFYFVILCAPILIRLAIAVFLSLSRLYLAFGYHLHSICFAVVSFVNIFAASSVILSFLPERHHIIRLSNNLSRSLHDNLPYSASPIAPSDTIVNTGRVTDEASPWLPYFPF